MSISAATVRCMGRTVKYRVARRFLVANIGCHGTCGRPNRTHANIGDTRRDCRLLTVTHPSGHSLQASLTAGKFNPLSMFNPPYHDGSRVINAAHRTQLFHYMIYLDDADGQIWTSTICHGYISGR